MLDFFSQMMRLPVAVFLGAMGTFLQAMRQMEESYVQTMDRMAGTLASFGTNAMAPAAEAAASGSPDATPPPNTLDQDLSGDDLKLVRYRILQTRRDREEILTRGEILVNYSTTVHDLGGLLRSEFVREHAALVREPGDERYIRTVVEVIARYPKREQEYEREQVEVLREIRDRI